MMDDTVWFDDSEQTREPDEPFFNWFPVIMDKSTHLPSIDTHSCLGRIIKKLLFGVNCLPSTVLVLHMYQLIWSS